MTMSFMTAAMNKKSSITGPLGCDTFVAFYPSTPKGTVVFGKNSDRPAGEGQSICRYPARERSNPQEQCQCTYISIPQAPKTHAVLLSQIDWMFGAEHGTNEKGVVVGNEAVWTKVNDEDLATKRLLGMDLVRLGLERGSTAKEALEVITSLLEEYGQGGPCVENDDSFVYHNSFLIADSTEAWVLETAGRNWVAKRIVTGARNISNTLTIRTDYDLHSEGLEEYAIKHKLWNRHDTDGDTLDWTNCFGDGCDEECKSPFSRQSCGRKLLETYSESKMLDETKMMEILRSHEGGICMHGGFQTAASMVSVLRDDGDHEHWMLDQPHPCQHDYIVQSLTK
jgi:secernin